MSKLDFGDVFLYHLYYIEHQKSNYMFKLSAPYHFRLPSFLLPPQLVEAVLPNLTRPLVYHNILSWVQSIMVLLEELLLRLSFYSFKIGNLVLDARNQ